MSWYIPHSDTHRGQKRVSDLLELKLQMSHNVGVEIQDPLESTKCF